MLPPLYQRWAEALLTTPLPDEPRATCLDCAMAPRPGEPPAANAFHPQLKCCTFLPALPNFLVGAILADDSPDTMWGRSALRTRIAQRASISPLGIRAEEGAERMFDEITARGGFGRSAAIRCPYLLQGGLCGIYRYRNAVCGTWFCKFDRGPTGRRYWLALQSLLALLERQLSHWAVDRLDLGAGARAAILFSHAFRHGPVAAQPPTDEAAWGRWRGRELELYLEAGRLVAALDWNQVLDIGGGEARLLASTVIDHLAAARSDELPELLGGGSDTLLQIGRRPGSMQATSPQAPYDPIDLPVALVEALPRVIGRSAEAAIAELAAEGLAVDRALMQKLVDYRLLQDVSRSTPPRGG